MKVKESVILDIVKSYFKQSQEKGKTWDYGWTHSDTMKSHVFNPISGESYFCFDNFLPELIDDLYITKTQTKDLTDIDLSSVQVQKARFCHYIKDLSNHGKHARSILADTELCKNLNALQLIALQEKANLIEVREVATRHQTVSVKELLELDPTNEQLQDLHERFKLYEIENDLPLKAYCEQNDIKLFTGINRQACNIVREYNQNLENFIILASTFKSKSALIRTYLHELTHASRVVCGDSLRLPRPIEEAVAECGSYYLQTTFFNNYTVLDYISHWLDLDKISEKDQEKLAGKVAKHLTIRLNSLLS